MKERCEITEKQITFRTQILMQTLGKNLKEERVKQKMSRVQLAFYANITESMICNIENGKKTGLSVYTLVKISESLDINIWKLFEV